MTTAEIAHRHVELTKQGKDSQALEELYADDAVSIEPCGNEQMPAEIQGIAAIKKKHDWWQANVEVHGSDVAGPFLLEGTDQFVCRFTLDATMFGQRSQMDELALFTVKDGKVVKEQFYYHAGKE